MRTGETICFETDKTGPVTAEVDVQIFAGTSRYVPDNRADPWREVIVVVTRLGAIVVRDRLRVSGGGGARPVSLPTWHICENVRDAVDFFAEQIIAAVSSGDQESARLYKRALEKLDLWNGKRV